MDLGSSLRLLLSLVCVLFGDGLWVELEFDFSLGLSCSLGFWLSASWS